MNSCRKGVKQYSSLDEIIMEYIKSYRKCMGLYLAFYRASSSIKDVITKATLAKTLSGNMYLHQRRIGKKVLRRANKQILRKRNQILKVKEFDEIVDVVASSTKNIQRFGDLTIYDTALRIGAWLDIYPRKVYLHCGTLKGCRNLGLQCNKYLNIACLPKSMKKLKAYEIEDFLCIYEKELKRFKVRTYNSGDTPPFSFDK